MAPSGRSARSTQHSVLILGLPYFGRMLEEILRQCGWTARFVPHPGRNPLGWLRLVPLVARADVVHLISSRIDRGCPQDWLLRFRRGPVVIHWNGTDVLIALDEHRKGNASKRIAGRAIHWCDAPWLVDELAPIGVRGDYVPLPVPVLTGAAPPLPERFRVLLYLPVDAFDREVFDIDTLLRLPRDMPGLDFVLIPSPSDTLPGPLPPNLEARGWVDDMDAFYREITVVVRLTSHDGTSFMVLEALSRGRHVIWTYPMPGVIKASGLEAVTAALRDLADRHAAGTLALNEEGRRHALDHFDRARLIANLDAHLRALLGQG